jgi:hypothetical protein
MEATSAAREMLEQLREKYGVPSTLRDPVVYSLNSSRLREVASFLARDLLMWPAALLERPPPVAVYGADFVLHEPAIVLTYPYASDPGTLEHEVRHHFSYECRRLPYLRGDAALTFLREYYWEEAHSRVARGMLQALHRSESREREDYREALHVLEGLSMGEFPRSRHLPDAVAGVITRAQPWIAEGFASEASPLDLARLPLKLLLGASTAGILYGVAQFLSTTPPGPLLLGIGYMCGGLLNTSLGFLRTLPLDIGVLRWRRIRRRIRDRDIPKVLAYPPTKEKALEEILEKIEEYTVFQA